MDKQYFTLTEAEQLVSTIENRVMKVMKMSATIDLLGEIDVNYDDDFEYMINTLQSNRKFFELSYKMYQEMGSLLDQGIIIKDIELGLVNFFSLHEGRDILLCWKVGDKNIEYWHEVDEGYLRRKPISVLSEKNDNSDEGSSTDSRSLQSAQKKKTTRQKK